MSALPLLKTKMVESLKLIDRSKFTLDKPVTLVTVAVKEISSF